MNRCEEVRVRLAEATDIPWLVEHDGHVGEEVLQRKVSCQEVVVAEVDGVRVGMLRLDYLWSALPYIALARVLPDWQRQGVGRSLVAWLEEYARGRGEWAILSSSMANEPEPQAWHRALGFEDCGALTGLDETGVPEVFFRLPLSGR